MTLKRLEWFCPRTLLASFLIIVPAHWALTDDADVARVIDAWKRREQAAVSIKAEIEESYLAGKGTLTPPTIGAPELVPSVDHRQERRRLLTIDSDKMLHKVLGHTFSPEIKEPVPEEMTAVTDGAVAKTLRTRVALEMLGFVHAKATHPDRWNLYLGGILKHYRPLSSGLGSFAPEQWEIVDSRAKIEESPCWLIRQGKATDTRYKEFWVDIEKEMALVRYHDYFERRLENELDITYARDEQFGWVPATWKVARYSKGKLLDSASAKVARLSLIDPIPPATFTLEFSTGTRVMDHSTRAIYTVP